MLHPHADVAERAQELSELDALLGAAASGLPQCAVVEGPAGIGKTALCEAFAARHPELTVRRADASPWESGLRGGLLAQLGVGTAGPADPGGAMDAETATEAAGAARDGGPWGLAADRTQPGWLPAGRAALAWLADLASEGPALILLGGIEAADALSLEALAFALRRARGPLTLLATLRPEGLRPGSAAAEFAGAVRARRLRLGPLSPEGLHGLARARTGVDLAPEAVQTLWRVSRGNPGLALEALEEGLRTLGGEALAAEGPPSSVRSVAERAAAALAGLPAPSRALVEAVSVLGGSPAAAAAALLAGLPADDAGAVLAAADAAWSAGLLECRSVAGSLQLTIRDPLVRDAVHEGLGPLERSALHARAAELADTTRDRVRHLVAAAVMPDAGLAAEVDALAEAEAAEGDWGAAADALVAAARLHTDPARREDRLLRAAEAMIGAGDLARAAPLARQIESFPQSAERDTALAYHAIHTGQARRAGTLLARAWETRRPTDAGLSARIAGYRVLDALGNWDVPAMLAWTETAVNLAGADSTAGIEARAMLGLALGSLGRTEDALRAYDELSSSPQLAGRDQRLHLGRGWLALAQDDLDTARLELRAAIPPVRRPGSLRITLWAHGWLARAEFAAGRWDDALATARAGVALNAPVRMDLVAPLLHLTAAQVSALQGDAAGAAEHSRLAQAGQEAYPVMRVAGAMAAAAVAESAGDYGAVVRAFQPIAQLDRSRGLDEPGFWPWQDTYANALVMSGQPEAADAFLAPLEEAARAAGHRSTTARLGYVRGRILGAQGRIDEAVAAFRGALAAIEGLALPWLAARVRFAFGQTLRRAGRRRDASEVLAAARDAFAVLGADVYVARCERELQAAGTRGFLPRAAGEADDGAQHPPSSRALATTAPSFTSQEEAVARLVAAGRSNRDAANELFVSVKTVQYHLTRIYAKLGIGSRSELAALYRGGGGAEAERAESSP